MILTPFEWMIAKRYMLPGRGEAFIALVAGISLAAVMLGVAALVIVMSVMNGFRGELLDKIVGLNGHAVIQAYGGRLENWQGILEQVRKTPGVVHASPLIEQPLLATFNGRVEAVLARGNTDEDIRTLGDKRIAGSMAQLVPGSGNVAIGSQLAQNLGARVGDTITIINPQGRSTPFGTVPRQIGYRIAAIFEIGIYDYDQGFVVMPIHDAQTLLLTGDSIGMIEVKTEDADTVGETLAPLKRQLAGRAEISDWKKINASLFEALAVERVAMFVVLWWFSRKPRPRYAVSGMFALLYGGFRFLVEFVRVPDAQLGYLAFGWLTMGQVLSLPLVALGLFWLLLSRRTPTLQPQPVVPSAS